MWHHIGIFRRLWKNVWGGVEKSKNYLWLVQIAKLQWVFLDFKSLLCVKPIIFLPISFVYHSFQIFTSAQPHHFSSFSYMIWYKFKPLLWHNPMIFLLIVNRVSDSLREENFFFLFVFVWQIHSSFQPYDFSAFSLYNLY